MAGTGNEDRATEGNSFSEPATAGVQQVAKVAAVTVDLRDGIRNEPRTPEYRAIHGLSADADDTHEDWIARLHPEDRDRTVRKFIAAVAGTGALLAIRRNRSSLSRSVSLAMARSVMSM